MPPAVPKLPTEFIHRHRLMKQVVNCLLDLTTGPRDTDDDSPFANSITCITSRHSNKAGNSKTTLAVVAMQTVEVREFFSDGIAWIHLGRIPLGEREVRQRVLLPFMDPEAHGRPVMECSSFIDKCNNGITYMS